MDITTANETATPTASDETGGWIFSDEYHAWQDTQARTSYRHGSASWLRTYGWSAALYSIKSDTTDVYRWDVAYHASSWPDPPPAHDLQKTAPGFPPG